jgi:hypothetical protein
LYLGTTMSLRLVGPPLIPFFPVHPGNPKHIYVAFIPPRDSALNFSNAPEFVLRPKGSNVLISPVKSNSNGVKQIYSFDRSFDIGKYSPDTLEVVFLKKFNGCTLPSVTFIASKRIEYEPLVFPSH